MSNEANHLPPQINLPEDDQNKKLIRFFILSSLVSFVVILALFGTGIYFTFQNYIQGEAEAGAIRISQALLKQDRPILIHSDANGQLVIRLDHADFPRFDSHLRDLLKALNVSKIKIYDADKTIAYSNDYDIIGQVDNQNRDLQKALQGETRSKLEKKGEFWDLEGEKMLDIDMVETYIPIFGTGDEVIGAYEIYLDVSRYHEDVRQLVLFALAIITAILCAIFLVIFFLLKKATGIIRSKTHEIKVLSGLLPVCSFCKKIRNENGRWEMMEEYITARSESVFSHSFCPECVARHYPELNLKESDYS